MKLIKVISTNKYEIIEDSLFDSNLHIDRSDNILYWDQNSELVDYCFLRSNIQRIISNIGFNNLRSNAEKDVVLKYTNSASSTEVIGWLVSKGLTVEQASLLYLQKRSIDIRNSAICFGDRINDPAFTTAIIAHFSQTGTAEDGQIMGELFLDNCRNFISDLKDSAILGTQYGNARDGFFDYIDDTGSYKSNPGLSTFFTLPEEQPILNSLRKAIKDLIYYGYTT